MMMAMVLELLGRPLVRWRHFAGHPPWFLPLSQAPPAFQPPFPRLPPTIPCPATALPCLTRPACYVLKAPTNTGRKSKTNFFWKVFTLFTLSLFWIVRWIWQRDLSQQWKPLLCVPAFKRVQLWYYWSIEAFTSQGLNARLRRQQIKEWKWSQFNQIMNQIESTESLGLNTFAQPSQINKAGLVYTFFS